MPKRQPKKGAFLISAVITSLTLVGLVVVLILAIWDTFKKSDGEKIAGTLAILLCFFGLLTASLGE